MKKNQVLKVVLASMLIAIAVVGSLFSFPLLGAKCAPVQHIVNIVCAVLLGPGYGVAVAFGASFIRNCLSLGSFMAFPGSMIGAFLCGMAYKKTHRLSWTLAAEVFGTAVLGGLCAYPVATLLMGIDAGQVAFYAYIIPFFISTFGGSIIAGIVLGSLEKSGVLKNIQKRIG